MNRRDFVARAAVLAGGAALGCRSTDDPPDPESLDHIIVVTMENRSFDHLLGWVPGADGRQAGLTYTDSDGVAHLTSHYTDTSSCAFNDPNHSYEGARQEYNNGACDGWLRTDGNDLYTISYYLGSDLPFLGTAATEWLVLDRYFCPIMGPTYPNRNGCRSAAPCSGTGMPSSRVSARRTARSTRRSATTSCCRTT